MGVREVIVAGAVLAGASTGVIGSSGQAASPGSVSNRQTAAISGVVTDAATGRPLALVNVALRVNTGAPLARITSQLTDERGRFVFQNLAAAEGYTISTAKPGHVDGAYGQGALFGSAGRIKLADGEWFAKADIVMWKPGAISGRVSDEAGEPLVDVFVRVLARQFVAGAVHLFAGPVARTDDRGEYRIAGLGPGEYLVHVPSVQTSVSTDAPPGVLGVPAPAPDGFGFVVPSRTDAVLDPVGSSRLVVGNYTTPPPSESGRSRAYPMMLFPGVSTPDAATVIDLALGEERLGIDFSLRPVLAVQVEGVVVGPDEAMKGLLLRLVPVGLEGLANGAEVATTLVGSDRRFTFLNVPTGDYIIDAPGTAVELIYQGAFPGVTLPQPPGIRWGSSSTVTLDSGAPGTAYKRSAGSRTDQFWTRTPISVGDDGARNLAVTLSPSKSLPGRLVYEDTTKTTIESILRAVGVGSGGASTSVTTTTTPRPSSRPTIAAEPADGNPRLGLPRSNRPAAGEPDDYFLIEGLKPGEYVLRVMAGLSLFGIRSIAIDGLDITHKPLDTSLIGPRSEVVITLTDKVITLAGSVRDERGGPTDSAVLVFPAEREQWSRYGYTPARMRAMPLVGTSEFSVKGLPAGDYMVAAVDVTQLAAWQDPGFLGRAARVATPVTLQWGDERTLALTKVVIR